MSRRGKIATGVGLVLVLGTVAFVVLWVRPTRRAVDIGAAMLAKQVCSCVYVANREVEDCRADESGAMDPIRLEVIREEERVRAWVPGLGERTAIHREGLGCSLE